MSRTDTPKPDEVDSMVDKVISLAELGMSMIWEQHVVIALCKRCVAMRRRVVGLQAKLRAAEAKLARFKEFVACKAPDRLQVWAWGASPMRQAPTHVETESQLLECALLTMPGNTTPSLIFSGDSEVAELYSKRAHNDLVEAFENIGVYRNVVEGDCSDAAIGWEVHRDHITTEDESRWRVWVEVRDGQ